MNKNKYTFMEGLIYKVSLVMLFALIGIVNVLAENTTYAKDTVQMDAFSIKPGETKVVAVNLSNSDALTSLQMDLTLPEGLSCIAVTRNEDRLGRDEDNRYEQSVTLTTPSQTNSSVYGVTILTNSGTPFVGNSGALVYLTIKAVSFNAPGTIHIDGIIGSDSPKSGSSNKYLIASSTVIVAPQVAKITTPESSFSIKSDGTLKEIDVQLNNDIALYGLQADITLPAGIAIDTKSNGDFHFYYTDRLPQSFSIGSSVLSSQKVRVAIASPSHEAIIGKSGTLFSFKVKAGEALVKNSNIIIDNVFVSDTNDVAYNLLQSDTINVTNQTIADNEAKKAVNDTVNKNLTAVIAVVQAKLDTAKIKITTDCADVADKFVTTEDSIQKAITIKTDSVKAKYDAVELTKESIVNTSDIEVAITKLIADATVAEKAFVDQIKKAVNDTANKKLTATIAAVQAKLDVAKTTIATDYKDVADKFVTTEDSIQKVITFKADSVKTKYEAVELTVESTVDTVSIETAIIKMVTDATAAEKVFTENEAKKAANEAANTKLTAVIKSVQGKLDTAKDTVSTKCKDVVDQFVSIEKGIQAKIDSITASVNAKYEAVELTAESTIDTVNIQAAITKMVTDATAAEKAFTENSANEAANEAAYAKLTDQVSSVQINLQATKIALAASCADVVSQFADRMAGIQTRIEKMKDSLKVQYDAVALTTESTVNVADIEAAISELITDATAAEKAFTENEEKKEANEAANTKLTAVIALIQEKLDAAKDTVATKCKDVVSQFVSVEKEIQTKIDSITNVVNAKYKAVELTAESAINTADIEAAISKLITDAKKAQRDYDIYTGINPILDSDANVQIYSISGQHLTAPVKGTVNIIRFSNGKIKKIFVK
jgi:hypothetical protein